MKRITLLLFVLGCFAGGTLSAYDFSDDRIELRNRVESKNYDPDKIKMTILFETVDQSNLRRQTNLLELKSNLAREMLKDFQVADPIIVNSILKKNGWDETEVKNDKDKINRLSGETGAGFILFVTIRGRGDTVVVDYRLVDLTGSDITEFDSVHKMEKLSPLTEARVNSNSSAVSDLGSKFLGVLPMEEYRKDINYAYSYFTHTGFLIPRTQSLTGYLWLEDISEVNLPFKYIRYDIRYKIFQFGLNAEGNTQEKHRSTRAYVKAALFDGTTFDSKHNFSFSLGLLKDISREREDVFLIHPDGKDSTDENRELADRSFLLAGSYHIDPLGLTLGIAWENIKTVFQSRFSLYKNLNFQLDYSFENITTVVDENDFSVGLQLFPVESVSVNLFYQDLTEQTTIGFGVDF